MTPEVPLQQHMFKAEPVDNRTAKQKRLAKQRAQPRTMEMFSAKDIAPIGVNPHPALPFGPGAKPKLVLEIQDTRAPEEIEAARMREAQSKTYSFVPGQGVNAQSEDEKEPQPQEAERKTWGFPSGTFEVIEVQVYEDDPLIPQTVMAAKLTERLNVLFWNTPEEEAARLDMQHRGSGCSVSAIDGQIRV